MLQPKYDEHGNLITITESLKHANEPGATGVSEGRRGFMRAIGFGSVAVAGTTALSGCGSDDDPVAITYQFGVASGDPLSDRVILWTRVTPSRDERIELDWQVASDAAFATIVSSGKVSTSQETDYTVKADATGLQPGRSYFYRFAYGGGFSPVGRTKTLPVGATTQVKLAVFSCSNYPAGFFNAYADAAVQAGIDAAVHLGDYIYEYARDGYASANAAALGRTSEPSTELIVLADYRRRHAQYRSDPDLQALTAAMPLIAVWDDHELANNAWRDGAENHQAATEGAWSARRVAAIKAYHEWMPIRTSATGPAQDKIYRGFDFGNLLSLHMLDTRLIGRDLQLSLNSYVGSGGAFDGARFVADVGNPTRQLLGAEQATWLQSRMQGSTATWQVLGQQILMGRMVVPAPIVLQQISVAGYAAIVAKARTAPTTLTPQEQAILAAPSIPYNLDAWDGYAAQRETVLGTARTLDKNLVVLAGDTHNAWGNDLKDASNRSVGVEFACASVSSPGFESIFTQEDPVTFAAGLEQLIEPLVYMDASRRGYMIVTATATECRCDWRFVSAINSRTFTASTGKSLRVLPGATNRVLTAV